MTKLMILALANLPALDPRSRESKHFEIFLKDSSMLALMQHTLHDLVLEPKHNFRPIPLQQILGCISVILLDYRLQLRKMTYLEICENLCFGPFCPFSLV